MIQLDGDLDLFGDGTLVVKRWVAHTPGSQMMTVRLKNTGLTILTGDNVYFRENVEKNLPPNIVLAYYPTGFYTAYEWIRQQMATPEGRFLHRARPRRVQGDEEGAGLLRLGGAAPHSPMTPGRDPPRRLAFPEALDRAPGRRCRQR